MKDDFGQRMKQYEGLESDRRFMPLLPIMARLDGKSFHSFCRGLEKPFDKYFREIMTEVTKYLVKATGALVGYTQSDEISLVWYSDKYESQVFFDGRIAKMTSVLAAMASSKFNRLLPDYLPFKAHLMPLFDCRVWQVPNQTEAANVFLWREMDAVRNSVALAAQSQFSHKELFGKSCEVMKDMLLTRGIDWGKYPDEFKRGVWIRKTRVTRPFTTTEINKLPPKHQARTNPDLQVERWEIQTLEMPLFQAVMNRGAVIFDGAKPKVGGPNDPY